MVVASLLASVAILGGILLTYLFDSEASFPARVCTAVPVGFAALAFFGFLALCFLPFNEILLLGIAFVCAAPMALLANRAVRNAVYSDLGKAVRDLRQAVLQPTYRATAYFVFYALTGLLFWAVFRRVLFVRADGLYTGFSNNVGDLPFHLQIITSFVHSHNFPPDDPTYTGTRFTYPFLADLVAALFVHSGASVRDALFVENLLFSLALVGLLHRWTSELTRDAIAGLIAPVLVLFSGGLGWLALFKDAAESQGGIWEVLRHPPHDYTIITGTEWRWGNALTTLLVPQRSMLFGLCIAVAIFTQWWLVLENDSAAEAHSTPAVIERRMIAAGVLAGLLPLIHTHTWIVVMTMAVCLALLLRRWRDWSIFLALALLVASPQILWMLHGSSVKLGAFWAWHFGWDRGEDNAIWFWLKNTGLFIPSLVAAVLWRRKEYLVSPRLLRFYSPFVLCFLMPNTIKLAPWVWDNIKVLFYSVHSLRSARSPTTRALLPGWDPLACLRDSSSRGAYLRRRSGYMAHHLDDK